MVSNFSHSANGAQAIAAQATTPEVRLAAEMLQCLQSNLSRNDFISGVFPQMLQIVGGRAGGVISQRDGRWSREFWLGSFSVDGDRSVRTEVENSPLLEALISDAMDRGETRLQDKWCVSPIVTTTARSAFAAAALVIELAESPRDATARSAQQANLTDEQASQLIRSAQLLSAAIGQIENHDRLRRRIEQLTTVLDAAAGWQHLEDDEQLLHEIANTACQLLDCERASIFLWDRRRGKLVGRPALGITGNVLEVDDDVGVVGEVLRTSEPKIWNAGSDEEQRVSRAVDHAQGFQTRSLVAVPMARREHSARDQATRDQATRDQASRGSTSRDDAPHQQRGQARAQGHASRPLLGVFEALNRRQDESHPGGFDAFDVAVLTDLATHASVAIESLRTRRTLAKSRDRLIDDAASASQLIGQHPLMEAVRRNAAKVAGTDLTVLVLGMNGTGKEVLARNIHYQSKRKNGPFVAVNCAAIVESLLESELFGHERGAFTDAQQTRPGKFEQASGGTLFLDEVGDLSPGGQAKLLRVLEEKVVVRVGGSQTIPVDVRVIAATNQPLEQMIAERRFREDLFFRLNVVSLTLPPLHDRGEDILQLAEHFLVDFCRQVGRQVPVLQPDAKQAMLAHPWRGNVRELRNTIERVCYLCSEDQIGADDLMLTSSPASRLSAPGQNPTGPHELLLSEATRQFQVEHIDRAIAACEGNMTEAAESLGLHRSNLYRKMRQLGISTSDN